MKKKFLLNSWISIDPGFNTGIAVWKKDQLVENYLHRSYLGGNKDSFREVPNRIDFLCDHLEIVFDHFHPKLVIIEGVYLFVDGLTSMTAAKRGDLFKLAYIVGAYTRTAQSYTSNIRLPLAREWKGQLPDDVIARRVEKYLGHTLKDKYGKGAQHVYDAIGIGMDHMGVLC